SPFPPSYNTENTTVPSAAGPALVALSYFGSTLPLVNYTQRKFRESWKYYSITKQLFLLQSSYYLHGICGVIVFTLWFILYKDDPQLCKRVSKKELTFIQNDKSVDHIEHKQDVPYKALLTSPVILCVWFNAFCEMSSMIMLSTYAPIYFRRIFGFAVETTGVLISLTTVAQLPFKLVAAYCSDRIV
ncbi:hypothetical protein OSTOST_10747, partial [Ostertagia ostertagi]